MDFTLDSAMDDLERLLGELENPETSLEESLKAFEAGIGLTRKAQHALSAAEQKVRLLVENIGEPLEENFHADEEHG